MFNIGKTSHDSFRDALRAAHEDAPGGCAELTATTDDGTFAVQYLWDDPDNWVNISPFDDDQRRREVASRVDLFVDAEPEIPNLLLASEATTADGAHDEIQAVLDALDATDTQKYRSFETLQKGEEWSALKSLLPFCGRDSE